MDDLRLELELARFLYREAEFLDDRAFDSWLGMLAAEIDYRVPVRTTRYVDEGDGFSNRAFFMKEDLGSLQLRVSRLKSDFAWSENPPSRTRRIIGNVRLGAGQAGSNEFSVRSNFAILIYRGEATGPSFLSGERRDVITRAADGWRLKSRLVLLDTTILGLESLSIFL